MAGFDKLHREHNVLSTIKKATSTRKKSTNSQLRSEGRLRTKTTEIGAEKQPLTGFEPIKKERGANEIMRMESSYGTIAFGGNERREMTVMVSEKRRHNSAAIDKDKKRLREANETERPLGRGKVASRNNGAVAFRYKSDATRNEVLAGLRDHLARVGNPTARQMLPFMEAKRGFSALSEERDKKIQNENAFRLKLSAAMEQVKSAPPKEKEKRAADLLIRRVTEALQAAECDDVVEEGGLDDGENADIAPDAGEKSGGEKKVY